MADDLILESKTEDFDIENMKVVDLKKMLKSYGLPVTGNKSELVERLQEVLISGKDIDSVILQGSNETDSAANSLDDNLLEDFSFSSPEKDDTVTNLSSPCVDQSANNNSSSAPVPLKKRAVAPVSEEKVEKKRIVLKRNNIPTPKITPKPIVPLKAVIQYTDDQDEDYKNVEVNVQKSISDTVVRLSDVTKKDLSANERISMRAKRFNISTEVLSKPAILPSAIKKQPVLNIASNNSTVPPSTKTANIDILKKRAQRFGENVSSVMKALEQQQKVLNRKSKFGATGTGDSDFNSDEQEKKKRRAERFGI